MKNKKKKKRLYFRPHSKNKLRINVQRKFEKSDYEILLFKKITKKTKITYKQIPISKFKADREYNVYIRHRGTRIKRLLAFGRLHDLPIVNKRETSSAEKPILLGGRRFKPLKIKKVKGNWMPTYKLVKDFESELKAHKEGLQLNYVAGSILPLKRYFHKKWNVFSDYILKGSQKFKEFFVNASIVFDYPGKSWVQKRNIKMDVPRGIMLRNLPKHLDKFETLLNQQLAVDFPKVVGLRGAPIARVVQVNGFIPLR